MTSFFVDTKISGTSVVLSKRATNRIIRSALRESGTLWDRRFLRLHFLPSAGARYGYAHRSKATRDKKLRLARLGKVARGGRADLVHTGLTEQTVVRNHFVRATATKASVGIVTPSYVTARVRTKRIHLDREIKTVIASEAETIRLRGDKELQKQTKIEEDRNRYNR